MSRSPFAATVLPRAISGLAALVLTATLAACGGSDSSSSERDAPAGGKPTYVVGHQSTGIKGLSEEIDAFKGASYDVEWANFSSGPALISAIGGAKVDLGDLGSVPPITAAAEDLGFRLVAKEEYQPSDFVLVPEGSPVKSFAQLRGKSVGLTNGTSAHGYVVNALKAAGVPLSEVKLVNLSPAAVQSAFRSGKVDAATLYQPAVSINVSKGARILGVGKPPLAPNIGFYASPTRNVDDPARKADIADLLQRLGAAYEWGLSHKDAWAKVVQHETGVEPKAAAASVEAYQMKVRPISPQDVDAVQRLSTVFYELKQIDKPVDISGLVENLLPEGYAGKHPGS